MPAKKTPKSFSLISDQTFDRMYAAMLGCRAMQKRKRNVLTPGQEAVLVGATLDLQPTDTIAAPSGEILFRTPQKPGPTKAAREKAALEEARHNILVTPNSSGAQLTIATGIALANLELPGERIVVAFGDATPEALPAWNEALVLAGQHRLPVLYILRYTGESPGRAGFIAALEQRAKVSNVMAIPVDFADAVAMYRVSYESIARARKRTGSTLILATPYVVEGAASEPSSQDPIARIEAYLKQKGIFSAKRKAEILAQFKQ